MWYYGFEAHLYVYDMYISLQKLHGSQRTAWKKQILWFCTSKQNILTGCN